MKSRHQFTFGHGMLFAGLVLAVSCSRPSSSHPVAPGGLQSAPSTRSSADGSAFPLLEGSFTILARDGDGIIGTYTGTSTFSGSGHQKSSLALQVIGGTGAFSGATGALAVSGTGAFADEGSFTLNGNGELLLPGGRRAVVNLSLRGNSVASCSLSARIAIQQSGSGSLGRAGRVEARLNHELGETGCSS